jgi:uncharacterized DUF497 family protein
MTSVDPTPTEFRFIPSLDERIYICIGCTMMELRISGFDFWDEGNRAKCQKHGLSIAQVEALFAHNPRIAPDPKHSADEDRLIAVGRTTGRHVFVAFTIRVKQPPLHPPRDGAIHAREGDCRL